MQCPSCRGELVRHVSGVRNLIRPDQVDDQIQRRPPYGPRKIPQVDRADAEVRWLEIQTHQATSAIRRSERASSVCGLATDSLDQSQMYNMV